MTATVAVRTHERSKPYQAIRDAKTEQLRRELQARRVRNAIARMHRAIMRMPDAEFLAQAEIDVFTTEAMLSLGGEAGEKF